MGANAYGTTPQEILRNRIRERAMVAERRETEVVGLPCVAGLREARGRLLFALSASFPTDVPEAFHDWAVHRIARSIAFQVLAEECAEGGDFDSAFDRWSDQSEAYLDDVMHSIDSREGRASRTVVGLVEERINELFEGGGL